MAIDWIKDKIVFICESCDATLETGTRSFIAAGKARQSAGWRVRHQLGFFLHFCPSAECQQAADRV